ncbi:arsenate reductase family protein [Paenibacillus sp. JX-17]|uniref:Arsenate reductase family protein n=1 Tax=Paenibacillus lacisoli TaxID=3064525 RepID=A0ABT9CEU6_9BACL|nr:arsenate reductase family protein [Paenibacillus sp. JX-17]MDO7907390.1 arsenate reductase family protein [Paenibacillus sp. JX-17]
MSELHVYQYSKCGTCRKAVKWLQSQGHELELTEIFENPPGKEKLAEMISSSGLDIKKFFNTSGEVYKEMKLKDKLPGMTEDEQLSLLASNGRLIKRPIVTDGSRVTVGFKEEQFQEIWSK